MHKEAEPGIVLFVVSVSPPAGTQVCGMIVIIVFLNHQLWTLQGTILRPPDYESGALTN